MKNKFFYLFICIIILCGITIIFSCFSGEELPDAGLPTGTSTGIVTGTATGTVTGTSTGTETGTSTGTETGTSTGTATGLPEPPTFGFLNINTALTSSYLSSGFIVGTASDNYGTISTVEYSLDGGTWSGATGTDNWKIMLQVGANAVVSGTNTWLDHTKHTLELCVYDNDGSNSTSGIITFNKGLNKDFNGDGYADAIVGAHYNDDNGSNAGATYIYYGSSLGISSSAGTTLLGDINDDEFGYSVASCGDINADGYADAIVGAPFSDIAGTKNDAGKGYIFLGQSEGISSGNANTVKWCTLQGMVADDRAGWSVASCGDVNGDGYSDIIIGSVNGNGGTGRVDIFHGSSVIPGSGGTRNGVASGDGFGHSVSGCGDVNGDGYSDIIVGANGNDDGGSAAGAAYVYYGSSSGISTTANVTFTGNATLEFLGHSVGSCGDVNDDGYADAIVGAFGVNSFTGATYIYHGSGSGLSTTANTVLLGGNNSDQFGYSVGNCGDINGDGYTEAFTSATVANSVYIFYGISSGITSGSVSSASTTLTGDNNGFGISLGSCGDANGDGYADAIVGAYSGSGVVYVFHGSNTGITSGAASSANTTLNGAASNDEFGYSAQ